ncbi:DUF1189 family protein [Oceanobacillus salinisoli]|uniref:DUF1189 family protein n=1 Tax=Oceanobacillus salinisoli TaxID=2678611 RepID=UPI0012E1C07C|nr:DUF1189 family protein [Oceanobacillus salinisoli]
MIFWNSFLNSMKLPNKQAMFQLNRVGLDIAIFYILILLLIVSIPSLVDRLTDADGFGSDINLIFTLIYFFIFYYLPLTVIVFAIISITAYLGKLISKILKRKLHYSLLWKMTAFTITIPFLLYTILAFLFSVTDIYLLFAFIYSFGLLCRMIFIYPKRRIRS